ncbi:MAG TPA: S8 family peptidase [Pyrinomonadaceae bacterium]|nr:S8 family peptidase [Pyrinomonadaceae bacterium]
MRKLFTFIAAAALCAVALVASHQPATSAAAAPPEKPVKADKYRARGKEAIPDQYIVVLNEEAAGLAGQFSQAAQVADVLTAAYGGKVNRVYKHALQGFAVSLKKDAALALAEDPRVAFVEEDAVVTVGVTQTNATWGLDRTDQRDRPLNGTYIYNWTGSNVRAYVIDTGIRTAHAQFGGRAAVSFDAFGGNGQDCNGHGTHVAGTIGGSTYGIAKSAQLRAVRVLNCSGSGSTSSVVAGVDWVRANHVKPAVANMSLGGGISSAIDTAVNNAINAGVTFVVAAGNSGANACNFSPARVAAAITVGSTTSTDARSSFSNFGTCVDIFAPGSSITSAWSTSNTATRTISGTSMASPHVAGVAALYLQANPSASNATVRNAIVNGSTTNRLTGIGTGSPNRLLYSLFF